MSYVAIKTRLDVRLAKLLKIGARVVSKAHGLGVKQFALEQFPLNNRSDRWHYCIALLETAFPQIISNILRLGVVEVIGEGLQSLSVSYSVKPKRVRLRHIVLSKG